MLCHNASSNLRLRSGVAPVNRFLVRGVRVALGLDEAGINDDRDMLQEMPPGVAFARVPGMEDVVPTAPQVFPDGDGIWRQTTGFAQTMGRLPRQGC